jgi:hypothetical protein
MPSFCRIVNDTDDGLILALPRPLYETADGRLEMIQKDYRVGGEVWQVHKYDHDPFPSRPHAHCIDGRHKGAKLHLGTRELFRGRETLGRFLARPMFDDLIAKIRPKFPDLMLPLPPVQ